MTLYCNGQPYADDEEHHVYHETTETWGLLFLELVADAVWEDHE